MIRIYSASYFENEHLLSNGLKTLHPLKCIETKSENEWKLDVEIDDTYAEYIEQNNVIVVDTKESSFQAFRIKNIVLDKRTFQFTAYHIGFDLQNYFIEDLELTSQSGLNFVTSILGGTLPSNDFTPSSDISATQSYHFIRVSAYEALQKTAELFGGYLVFNNFTVSLLSSIGVNRGVVIADGKNLQGLTKTENWDNVVTTLIATCGDRVYDPIDADVSYDIPYVKTMSFESEFETEVEIESDIIEQATEYINANKYPQVNYVVKSDIIQDVYIGDTIVVKSTYDLDTTVLAYTYDVISERIRSVEFGNYRPTVKNIFKTYASVSEVAKNTATVNQLVIDQTNIINGLYQYGYVVVNDNEIYVVDALPKETATYVLRINLGGIGFSSTGISGTYTSAWTLDGSFNANFIQAGSLNGINMSIGSGDTIFKADSNGIYLGNATFASAPFSVDMNGNLIATNADISGTITSSQGTIGGFTIFEDKLYSSFGGAYVGVSRNTNGYCFWAGSQNPVSAPFAVNTDGILRSGDFKIEDDMIICDNVVISNKITSSTFYGQVGFRPDVTGYPDFWLTSSISGIHSYGNFLPYSNAGSSSGHSLGLSTRRWLRIFSYYAPDYISDIRFKENAKEINDEYKDVLLKTKVIEYNLIGDNRKQLGINANEFYEQFGEKSQVVVEKNEDGYFGANYDGFIPMLIKIVQEQQKEIELLSNKVKELENLVKG